MHFTTTQPGDKVLPDKAFFMPAISKVLLMQLGGGGGGGRKFVGEAPC